MATTSSIAQFRNTGITFYEGITNFSVTPTNDDVLVDFVPAWDTVSGVANTPLITFNSNNSGAATDKVVLRNIHTPELANDAATKSYVDGIAVTGVSWKNTARAATTAEIATFPPTDGVTTVSAIDGITLAEGDRILVKDQTTGSENGIYVVTSGTWLRGDDLPAGSSASGAAIWVDAGTVNGDKGYVVTTDQGSDTVGTDAIVWAKFSSVPGVAGVDGDIQFSSTGSHGVATGPQILRWDDTNSKLIVRGANNSSDALELQLGSLSLADGDITLADNREVSFGSAGAFTLSTDGTDASIANTSGNVNISNSDATGLINVTLGDAAGATSFVIRDSADSALITTDSSGLVLHSAGSYDLVDSVPLRVGTGNDFQIVHDGTDSSMTNSTGELNIVQSASGSDVSIEHTSATAGDDMNFKVAGSTNGTSFNFIGDSQGTPATLVQIVAASENSTAFGTGTMRVTGGISATQDMSANSFYSLSDATTKTHITPLADPLSKIRQIEAYNYEFLPGYGKEGALNTGVLAQQLETVPGLEHCVKTDPSTGYKSVNYTFLIPMLIESVKTLSDKLDKATKK